MYEMLYVEINVICASILLYILLRLRNNMDQQTENRAFRKVVTATLLILVIDSCWIFVEGKPGKNYRYLNYFLNMWYLFQTGIIGYTWFDYVEIKLKKRSEIGKIGSIVMKLPLIALGLLTLSTPWSGLLFYVDQSNIYRRGDWILVQMLISLGYLLAATGHVILCMMNEKSKQWRREQASLCLFAVPTTMGCILGMFLYGVPIYWPFSTLTLLMVFTNFQSYQISTDGLTRLNNRRNFDDYLTRLSSEVHHSEHIFLFLMDINSFKKINDTYGHLEGDLALQETASILQKICQNQNAFLARYGGDEFAIIYQCKDKIQAVKLKQRIQEACMERNQNVKNRYAITMSIGYAEYGLWDANSIQELIRKADEKLYQEKKEYKSGLKKK